MDLNHSRTLSDDSTTQIFARNFDKGKTSFMLDPDDTIREENDEDLTSHQSSLMQEEFKGI